MITGGFNFGVGAVFTEIFDTEDGSVTIESPMNFRRSEHGIGVITINGENKLVVFGGRERYLGTNYKDKYHDSIEIYNAQEGIWEMTNVKLKEPKMAFGFLSVKLGNIVNGMQFCSIYNKINAIN